MDELNRRVTERIIENAKLYNISINAHLGTEENIKESLKTIYDNYITLYPTQHPKTEEDFEAYLLYIRNFSPFNLFIPFKCDFSNPKLKGKFIQQTIPGYGDCLFHSLRLGIPELTEKTAQDVRRDICDALVKILPELLNTYVSDVILKGTNVMNILDNDKGDEIIIEEYIEKMRSTDAETPEYGTRVEIMAAQLLYNKNICIYHMDGTLDNEYEIAKKAVYTKRAKDSGIQVVSNSTQCEVALYICGSTKDEEGTYKVRQHFELLIPQHPKGKAADAAKKKAADAAKKKAEEDAAKKKAEEETAAKKKAADDAAAVKKKPAEDTAAKKKVEEEAAAKKKAEEEAAAAKKKAEEAAATKKAEEAAPKKKAEKAAPKKKAEKAATNKKAEEEAVKKKAEDAAAAKKKVEEEAVAKKQAEEAVAKKQAEEAAATKKVEEEAAATKKMEEAAAVKKKAEDDAAAKKKAEAEAAAKKTAEEEKRIETAKVIKQIIGLSQQCQTGDGKSFKYKYLKYKIKYLTLKNNNSF